jgi:hypothetical protein
MSIPSAQAEEAKNGEDNNDQADKIDNAVHETLRVTR